MKSLKVLIFDIAGEYGHFRKFNTTSSPLTYAIPTPTALAGMLGAVLGIEREITPNVYKHGVIPVNELFNEANTKIAIQVLNPIKKTNIGFNLINTAKSFFNIETRTQVEFELLKNPKFRIFFSHEDEAIFKELSSRIRAVKHHFTPYLGLAQFTSTIEWIAEETITVEKNNEAYLPIHSAVNLSNIQDTDQIQFGNAHYITDTMPTGMKRDRVVTNYAEIILEKNGQPIQIKIETYWKSMYGNILFL